MTGAWRICLMHFTSFSFELLGGAYCASLSSTFPSLDRITVIVAFIHESYILLFDFVLIILQFVFLLHIADICVIKAPLTCTITVSYISSNNCDLVYLFQVPRFFFKTRAKNCEHTGCECATFAPILPPSSIFAILSHCD